jgi:type IV pilus assembly protein PilO
MDMSLSKLPWYAQIGAFVALAVAALGAFIWYYEMPARAEMAVRQEQLKAIRVDIAKGLATAKQLDEFKGQVADLEGRLENLRAVLPEEKDAADLLRRMQTVAVQSNLTIKSFKPSATVTQAMHAEWPISLELDGTFHNLATFFDRVGKFTRIVNISGVTIKNKLTTTKADPNSTISASCVATTFVLLDPAAPKAPVKGAIPAPGAPKKAT